MCVYSHSGVVEEYSRGIKIGLGGEQTCFFKTYIISFKKVSKIVGIDDFEKSQLNSKWGAHDEFVLTRQLGDLGKEKQPFFSVLMTLSSHEPFETPIATPFPGKDLPSKFRSAAWYTDKCLGEYFEKAKKQPWYKNTLFVLVADHGHLLPLERDYYDVENRHIPLLALGGALEENLKGQKINVTGNQNCLEKFGAASKRFSLRGHRHFRWRTTLNCSRKVRMPWT